VSLSAEDVREILQLLDAVGFDELHLETERFTVTLRRDRSPAGGWTQEAQVTAPPPAATEPTRNHPPAEGGPPVTTLAEAAGGLLGLSTGTGDGSRAAATGLWEVRAPLLGTFYRAPRPGAPPFVEVGSRVEEDSVVGIIETMKLMNSVLAGKRGKVAEVCLGNGQFAAEGAVLLRIDPDPAPAPDPAPDQGPHPARAPDPAGGPGPAGQPAAGAP
jgi:acetyl-CoA carboxylase biotin carboxyl carrier protein